MLGFEQGSRYHDMTTDEHVFTALETAAHVDAPLRVRMALLFHDSGKPETAWKGADGRMHYYATKRVVEEGFLTGVEELTEDHEVAGARIWRGAADRLNVEKALKWDVNALIENHMVKCDKVRPTTVRRDRVRLGDELLRDLYLMRMCDLCGKGKPNQAMLATVKEMEHERHTAQADGVPVSVKELAIRGGDVAAQGVHGKKIGEVLASVLDEVVCQPDELRRSRDWQLGRAGKLA